MMRDSASIDPNDLDGHGPGDANKAPLSSTHTEANLIVRIGSWIVIAAAVTCYLNTLSNGYCYDSTMIVEQNPLVHEPGR